MQAAVQRAIAEVFRIRELPGADRVGALEHLGVSLVEVHRVIQEDGYYLSEIVVLEERMQTIANGGRALLERIRTTETLR